MTFWQHQAIARTNVDLSSGRLSGINLECNFASHKSRKLARNLGIARGQMIKNLLAPLKFDVLEAQGGIVVAGGGVMVINENLLVTKSLY